MESRIGQLARLDARFSQKSDGAFESEYVESRSPAASGPQADEKSGDQPSVLLGGLCAGGRRQVIHWGPIRKSTYATIPFSRRASHFMYLLLRYDSMARRTATTP